MNNDCWQEYRGMLADQLGTDDLAPLLARASAAALASGEVLVRDGGPTDSLYLVLSGRLEKLVRWWQLRLKRFIL